MKLAILLLLAAVPALAACKSAEPIPPLSHPYKIVMLPVEGSKTALGEKTGDADVPLALSPAELDAKIVASVKAAHVFSDVVVAQAADLQLPGAEDNLAAAAQIARRTSSDLILRIQVKSARMTDLGSNGSTIWSTVTWFMIGIPSFWVDDRTYATDLAVTAELFDPDDRVRPTASVDANTDQQELDLWDRGLTPLVIVVPPAFLKGSPKTVSETLTDRAVRQLLAKLVEELRTKKIPSRFDLMDVAEEGGSVRVLIGTRVRLRSLEIEVDGRTVKAWAETGLVEEKDSTPERFVYRRSLPVQAKAGAQVRVIAEDESGGREVRTVVAGEGAGGTKR